MKNRKLSIWKLLVALLCAQLPLVSALADDTQLTIFNEPVKTLHYDFPDGGASNDSLFRHYVEQRFEAALPGHEASALKTGTRSGLDELSGNDAKLARALMPRLQAIARGDVKSGVITIPASEILDCNAYTAAQLGVSAIVSNGALTQDVQDKMDEIRGFDLGKVMFALLAEMPYELYWFDKAYGLSYSMPSYGYNSDMAQFVSTSSYTFWFYVAKEYSATNAVETYDLGATPSTVSTAVSTARSVVSSATGSTPAEKMWYYYNWISDNVTYNDEAANMNPIVYGNPWQLIWVFDNDPSTKVVCEGYSKAFKYLCDLSGFDDIECLLASGDLGSVRGGQQGPAGPHMWNVVRMDDGRNYLVDVTNGRNFSDQLFMYYSVDWSRYGFTGGDGYENGYRLIYDYEGNYLSFKYDDDTKDTFGEQALTLSTQSYEGAASKKVTLTELTDVASQLNSFKGQSGVHVNFRRTGLAVGQPATVCLPFEFPLPQINVGTFYTLKSVDVNETTGKWEAVMERVTGSTLSANTPYIFTPAFGTVDFSGEYDIPSSFSAGAKTVGKWSLTGTYAQKTWTAKGKDYGFAATDGRAADDGSYLTAGTFVRCEAGASVAPLRCYLSYSGNAGTRDAGDMLPETISVRFLDGLGQTTAIGELNTVTGEWTDDGWYDLNGRRLDGEPTAKGIYIHHGKKVRK